MPENRAFWEKDMQASAEKIWGAAQEHLRSMLSADTYNLWFAPLRACALENNSIMLEVANDFCEVWLKDNYLGLAAGRDWRSRRAGNCRSNSKSVPDKRPPAPLHPAGPGQKEGR